MIEIKNLTKIYQSKGKRKVKALNDVSFTLPDTGLIFITGKSGSGKSTLLNILGGLDEISSGEIVVFGNKISDYSRNMLSNYRSSYIGFIFQNYHLINDFTVKENIELGSDISNIEINYEDYLSQVDLSGYGNRKPTELSGGQQQRVAIARALAKQSRIILADEPTGNLDRKTTKQILDILKEISKSKLVILVSHNVDDAVKYADRIIKLDNGMVVSDLSRMSNYNNKFRIEKNTLYLPHHTDLTEEEIKYIMDNKDSFSKIIPVNNGMKKTTEVQTSDVTLTLNKSKLSFGNVLKLFKTVFKRKKLSKIFASIIAIIMISLFYIFQAFNTFNENEQLIYNSIENREEVLVIKKYSYQNGTESYDNIFPVIDEDLNILYEKGYNGNAYKLYNYALTTTSSTSKNNSNTYQPITTNVKSFYCLESYGILNCTENYLIDLYGTKKGLSYHGKLDDKDYGIIITDYMADSIMFYNKDYKTYDDILGKYSNQFCDFYINAIINTGYKDKYKDLHDVYSLLWDDNPNNDNVRDVIDNHSLYLDFINDTNKYLCVTYNISDKFNEVIYNNELNKKCNFSNCSVSGKNINATRNIQFVNSDNYDINDKEIIITTALYEKLSGKKYTKDNIDTFKSHEINIKHRISGKEYLNEIYNVKTLVVSNDLYIYVSNDEIINLLEYKIMPYALYLDDFKNVDVILDTIDDASYHVLNNDAKAIYYVNRIIKLISTFMSFLSICLLVACVIYLVYFGYKSIKNNKYEIGILSALGCRDFDVGKIFLLEILAIGLIVIVGSVAGILVTSNLFNSILIISLENALDIKFNNLRIISFIGDYVLIDLLIAFVIVFTSAVLSMLLIKRFNPVDILKAKE